MFVGPELVPDLLPHWLSEWTVGWTQRPLPMCLHRGKSAQAAPLMVQSMEQGVSPGALLGENGGGFNPQNFG